MSFYLLVLHLYGTCTLWGDKGKPCSCCLTEVIDSPGEWESLPEATAPAHLTFPGKQSLWSTLCAYSRWSPTFGHPGCRAGQAIWQSGHSPPFLSIGSLALLTCGPITCLNPTAFGAATLVKSASARIKLQKWIIDKRKAGKEVSQGKKRASVHGGLTGSCLMTASSTICNERWWWWALGYRYSEVQEAIKIPSIKRNKKVHRERTSCCLQSNDYVTAVWLIWIIIIINPKKNLQFMGYWSQLEPAQQYG